MPSIYDLVKSEGRYLAVQDVPHGTLAQIVSAAPGQYQDRNGQMKQTVLVTLSCSPKPWIMKPENSKSIVQTLGADDYTQWVGRQIRLVHVPTQMGPGLRASPVDGQSPAPPSGNGAGQVQEAPAPIAQTPVQAPIKAPAPAPVAQQPTAQQTPEDSVRQLEQRFQQ